MRWTNPIWELLWPVFALIFAFFGLVGLTGCNAEGEFGKIFSRSPGLYVRPPSLFAQGEVSITSDANAVVHKAVYEETVNADGSTKTRKFELEGEFGQNVTEPMKTVPAILDKMPAILESRVEIAKAITEMVPASISAVADAVSPIAAGAHALVGCFEAANKPVPPDVAELVARIDVLEAALKEAQATTQPASP